MKFCAPEDTEMKMGVLTESAKKSRDTWEYANKTCGKYWIRAGIAGIVLTTIAVNAAFLTSEKTAAIVSLAAAVIIVLMISCSMTKVMMKLHAEFDENGKPIVKE